MPAKNLHTESILKKIQALEPERVMEVEDFIDFLYQRDLDRRLVKVFVKLSEKSFKKIWDNPEDADYDKL